jgi:hypothetical protein
LGASKRFFQKPADFQHHIFKIADSSQEKRNFFRRKTPNNELEPTKGAALPIINEVFRYFAPLAAQFRRSIREKEENKNGEQENSLLWLNKRGFS